LKIQDIGLRTARGEILCDELQPIIDSIVKENDLRLQIIASMGTLGKSLKNALDRELEMIGLTVTQLQVVLYIFRNNEAGRNVTARELEQAFHVSNPTMSGILKRLEKKEWIERIADATDRRTKWIHIKGDTRQFNACVEERVQDAMDSIFCGFTQKEILQMYELMHKLLHNVKQDMNENTAAADENMYAAGADIDEE